MGLEREKLQNSTFIFILCYMNVLRTLYNCPSFERGSFFYFMFILTLTICSSLQAEGVPQCCARDGSHAGLRCISLSMNLDFNSNENLS